MRIEDFDFDLPAELIAQFPTQDRSDSRLLTLDGVTGAIADRRFNDLPQLLSPGDLLVFNDTRVMRARLFGRKRSGGKVEVLVERVLDNRHALALIRASHPPASGSRLVLADALEVEVLGREGDLYRLEFASGVREALERHGEIPLPPYIGRRPDPGDDERYQTVYAREPGAVAAPTAGLHFDAAMLERLRGSEVGTAFLTLHVGAGTFQPVRAERVEEHRMHGERYCIPAETAAAAQRARASGGRVIAVGTTSLRALESATVAGTLQAGCAETDLFVLPGYRFRAVDALITNFHLPRSTLVMLVSAFAGLDNVQAAYRHAIDRRYRFFSYGDAMFIHRRGPRQPGEGLDAPAAGLARH
jgi:S-adenosylmethionine:tRNA ribosyltransferase-isomerase